MPASFFSRIARIPLSLLGLLVLTTALFGKPIDLPTSLTPPSPPEPRINGPSIFGVRPGSPFLYAIPATGDRPLTFSIDNLPTGLVLDPNTGQITGSLSKAGEYPVTLAASNSKGKTTRAFKIVVGSGFALTPPMGWNSYNVWDQGITQDIELQSAKVFVASGLSQHGWTYVNMDDGWQGVRGGPNHALQPDAAKYTDIKGMVAQIHAMGLKVGLYSTPWIASYGGLRGKGRAGESSNSPDGAWDPKMQNRSFGKYTFVKQDAQQFADWGIDYIKYDWNPISKPETEAMEEALMSSGRDIYLSLSNNMNHSAVEAIAPYAQGWRTSGDITDSWGSMSGIGFGQVGWSKFESPGHFNDPDMLVVGWVGWGHPRPTGLKPDEQYTHISLWCMMSAPLIMGCDLTKLDPFTLGLLTNDEVLAVDQDALCRPADCINKADPLKVYVKDLEDGSKAIGLFNTTPQSANMSFSWADTKLSGNQTVRDLWRQKDLGVFQDHFSADVPPHGVLLLKVSSHP